MAYIVRMPKLGVEMEQGEVLEWRAGEGDSVEEEDVIALIESEKTQADVTAREAGVVRTILLDAGSAGEPGAAMGIVADPDESIDDLLAEAESTDGASDPGAEVAEEPAASTSETASSSSSGNGTAASGSSGNRAGTGASTTIEATPKARRRAREAGVDLGAVTGTGPQGAITEGDVERAAAGEPAPTGADTQQAATGANQSGGATAAGVGSQSAGGGSTTSAGATASASAAPTGDPSAPPASAAGVKASPRARKRAGELGVDLSAVEGSGPQSSIVEADVEATAKTAPTPETGTGRTLREAREQSGMRQTIARRLGQSWREAPHVTVDMSINAEPLFAAVEAAEASGYDVSMTDVLLRAVSETLSDHPEFNATFEDGIHRLYEEHNVGVAVDVDGGLVTPVLPDIGAKSVDEIADTRAEIVGRATSGNLDSGDLSGGTFTVSNLGMFGVDSFTPIINPPEVAILGVNTIEERPIKGERGGIAFQREISFSLSLDHRVVDGADAARFLATLEEHLERAVTLVP